ncbi:MAG TPA: AraC family transcriptional regulator [Nonomuraea sp.]|nr:AraC family transcriptional regulator [Nonomuraea sp.]
MPPACRPARSLPPRPRTARTAPPPPPPRAPRAAPPPDSALITGSVSRAPATPGTTSHGEAPSPPAASSGVTSTGADANPSVPPSENQLIRTWLPAAAILASRADSGWYAATPSPDSATASKVSAYESVTPLSATPSPAVTMLAGISHGIRHRSASAPNTGCTTGAGTWVAPASRALWIPAGTVHEHRAHGATEVRLIGLTANPLGLGRPAVLAVAPLLRELIIAYTDEPEPGDDAERERLLAVLLDRLRRAPEQALHLPTPRDPRLAAVCAALHADPADPRTLARHAAAAGTSDRTLARLCRAELGMTFPQWRTQLRLHRALLLLAEGGNVTRVAHRCGWSSASAFIDAFRRVFGYTPGRAFTV